MSGKGRPLDQISHYLPGIMLAYAAFLVGMMSPGPNILAVIGTSMSLGRRSGVALAGGIAAGSLSWGLLTVAGLSALLAAYAEALTVIKIVGGLYLLWLALKAFRAAAAKTDRPARAAGAAGRGALAFFLRGLTVQMTNPKAALTWIAVMSLGLQDGAPWWVGLSIVLGTFCFSLAGHAGYALAFSTPVMVRSYARARRWIQAGLGLFFGFAGIKLLTSRV